VRLLLKTSFRARRNGTEDIVPGRIPIEVTQASVLPSSQESAFLSIVRTADAMVRSVDLLLRGHGVTATQYNVLRILRGAGESGASCRDIGERLINAEPDITRLLDRMEKLGLISRCRESDDRRFVTVRITPAGLVLVNGLDEPIAAFHCERFASFSGAELAQLSRSLQKAMAGLKKS
jgi:DNA-binding MarR family transcriptional regulator